MLAMNLGSCLPLVTSLSLSRGCGASLGHGEGLEGTAGVGAVPCEHPSWVLLEGKGCCLHPCALPARIQVTLVLRWCRSGAGKAGCQRIPPPPPITHVGLLPRSKDPGITALVTRQHERALRPTPTASMANDGEGSAVRPRRRRGLGRGRGLAVSSRAAILPLRRRPRFAPSWEAASERPGAQGNVRRFPRLGRRGAPSTLRLLRRGGGMGAPRRAAWPAMSSSSLQGPFCPRSRALWGRSLSSARVRVERGACDGGSVCLAMHLPVPKVPSRPPAQPWHQDGSPRVETGLPRG